MRAKFGKALVFLVLSYVLLYLLYVSQDFLPKWDAYGLALLAGHPLSGYLFVDPLLWFLPLVSFGLMWLAMDAYLKYFHDRFVLSVPFALIFVVGSYAMFFIAFVGYFWNNAFLLAQSRGDPSAGISSFGVTFSFALTNFVEQLLKSPFFLFVLAALLGWVAYVIIHSFWDEPLPSSGHESPSSFTPST